MKPLATAALVAAFLFQGQAMGDLSRHFSRAEFACRCGCGFDTVDSATLGLLEEVRFYFGEPVIVNSGCRCAEHNRAVGGSAHSQHLRARAADIRIANVSPAHVHGYVSRVLDGTGGLGQYDTFTHVDTRTDGPARWDMT